MPKRILEGDVISDKMDKTVTVLVERRYRHPVYKKYLKRTDKYAAHDETNAFKIGDRVQIEECRPISKRKSWKVITAPGTATRSKKTISVKEGASEKTEAKKAPVKKAPAPEKASAPKESAKAEAPKKAKAEGKKATSKKKDDKK